MRSAAPAAEWGDSDYLLWSIEHSLRVLVWRQVTKDGQHGRRMPKPIETPGQRAEAFARRDAALAARDEIDAAFGVARGR